MRGYALRCPARPIAQQRMAWNPSQDCTSHATASTSVIVTPKGVLRLAMCNASATRKGL